MSGHSVHLVIALPAEAKPVIARLGLRRLQPDCGFPVYRKGHISLVVCGVGKANAAAAVALLQTRNGCPRRAVWINLGIAGHRDLPVGQAVLAQSITDAASGKVWRLSMGLEPPCPGVALETLDNPDFDYRRDQAFDMEASGFYAAALRFSHPELVYCLKVISDNREQSGRGISGAQVRGLIEQQLDLLEELMARLSSLADLTKVDERA